MVCGRRHVNRDVSPLDSMHTIRDRIFTDGPRHDRQLLSDFRLEGCTFDSWAGLTPEWSNPDPSLRPILRNIELHDTNAFNGYLEGAIIEDVLVDCTKAGKGPIFLRGNAYRHVVLRGRIGHTEIRGKMFPSLYLSHERQREIIKQWDIANAEYYQNVDWALDIREATFGSFSISGIPSRLVRRAPETTAVVTREAALQGKWRELEWHRGVFEISIGMLLDDGYDDVVLVACERSRRFKDDLKDLQLLRDAGVAT